MAENNKPKEELGKDTAHILNPLINVNGYLTSTDQIIDEQAGKNQTKINQTISDGNIWKIEDYFGLYKFPEYSVTIPDDAEDPENYWIQAMINDPNINWVLSGGSTSIPWVSSDLPYLWNYQVIHYQGESISKGDPSNERYIAPSIVPPVVVNVYTGMTRVIRYYQATDNPSVHPEENDPNWQKEVSPPVTIEKPYLWRKEEIYYAS